MILIPYPSLEFKPSSHPLRVSSLKEGAPPIGDGEMTTKEHCPSIHQTDKFKFEVSRIIFLKFREVSASFHDKQVKGLYARLERSIL